MTDATQQTYNWRQKPGPSDRQPSLHVIQIRTPLADNGLIRRLVGKGNLSGFGLFSCLVMLGVFYHDDEAWTRAEQAWVEMLDTLDNSQLEEIQEGLTSLIALVQEAMA